MKRISTLSAIAFALVMAVTCLGGSSPDPGVRIDVAGHMTVALNLNHGTIVGNMTGDLRALRRIQITRVDYMFTPMGFGTMVTGRGTIITANGKLFTHDRIFLKRITPGEPARNWHGIHRILWGSGDYRGATGRIDSTGTVGTGSNPLDYTGQINLPSPN